MAKHPQKFQWSKQLKSFVHAWSGVITFVRTENNARIHIAAVLVVTILSFLLKISTSEWIVITFCFGIVLTAEAFNTAIEYLCDIIQPEFHDTIKKVKDIAAGAVLITAITSAIIGGIIFLPYLISFSND